MSEYTIEIKCQKGNDAYSIMLGAISLNFFEEQARRPEITMLEGEALANALVTAAKGKVRWVGRLKNQVYNDGPGGEPAIQEFNEAGILTKEQHVKDGKLHDSVNGKPAQQEFDRETGQLLCSTRCKDGVICDGDKGEPAIVQYARGELYKTQRYRNGTINDGPNGEPAEMLYSSAGDVYCIRHKDGKRNDGSNGEPAYEIFDCNGNLSWAERYANGIKRGALAAGEFLSYSEALTRKKMAALQTTWGSRLSVKPLAKE
jgi:hypothetical protein